MRKKDFLTPGMIRCDNYCHVNRQKSADSDIRINTMVFD